MADDLEGLFAEISARATLFDEPILAHLCRLAALEAAGKLIPVRQGRQKLIGIWDWDIANDLNHLDPNCAELFGIEPAKAAKGVPRQSYIDSVHAGDLIEVNQKLRKALKVGGLFQVEYRIVKHQRVRRVFARGFCTLDKSGRPERLPGAIMEVDPL
jgi:PAS domain-containing protein